MALLTGQSREEHTAQLADALNLGNGNEIQKDEIDMTTTSEETTISNNDEDKGTFPTKETLQDDFADMKNEIKEDDIEITTPEITVLPDEGDKETSRNNDTSSLLAELEVMTDPHVVLERVANTSKNTGLGLIVSDDIEVKKEEIEESKRKSFTEEEDNYLKQGCAKYKSSKSKWADILKDPEYSFHPSRTRDTLRVRSNSLKNSKSMRIGNRRKISK